MCTTLRKIIVLLVLYLLFAPTELAAQKVRGSYGSADEREFRDNIRMQMPNGTTVEYEMNYKRFREYKSHHEELKKQIKLSDELNNFVKRWAVLGITDLEEKEPMFIDNSKTKIMISKRENIAEVEFPENTKLALTVNGRHKLKLVLENSNIFIYFDTIEQLEELGKYDMVNMLKNGDLALETTALEKENRKKTMKAWLSVSDNNQVQKTYQDFLTSKSIPDQLIISGTPILGNINGSWLPGYGFYIAGIFPYENREFFRVGLHYDFMYNFSANKTNISHWVDAAFSINLSQESTRWFGFSLGYLVKQYGNFFDNNKFRIGLPMNLTNHVSVTPQFYFKGFFKDAEQEDKYFGIKIAYSF